jgi:hypothetical protein
MDEVASPEGAMNVLTYISCAAGLATCTTIVGALVALVGCGKIIVTELSHVI